MTWPKHIRVEKYKADDMKEILYPRRFMSREEVDLYVGGDRIVCLLCNRKFENLSAHIARGHGCDPMEYRDILNIPRTISLCTPGYLEMLSENSKHTFYNVFSDEQRNWLVHSTHNPEGRSGGIRSTIAKESAIEAAKIKGKNAGKKHGRTKGKCSDCSAEIEISIQRVNRRVLCKACLKVSRAKQQKAAQDKKAEYYKEYRRQWYLQNKKKNG